MGIHIPDTYAQTHTYIQLPVSAFSLHVWDRCAQLTVVRKLGHSTRFEIEAGKTYIV